MPKLCAYEAEQDFLRIRDFVVAVYDARGRPYIDFVWWNYSRYFVAPWLGVEGMTNPRPEDGERAIRLWEGLVGVWKGKENEILGVAFSRDPIHLGRAFIQCHPRHTALLDEMLSYAETTCSQDNQLRVYINEYDEPFRAAARKRGYREHSELAEAYSEFAIPTELGQGLPAPRLPEGYVLRSMADENDLELRCRAFGLSYDYMDPSEWPPIFAYEELQKAPDYRKDLDLYTVGPSGEYVSCCIVWYDAYNKIGVFEPVGTHPEFRRRGFGREVVMEGMRRIATLGARRAYVHAPLPFYRAIGFRIEWVGASWIKEL